MRAMTPAASVVLVGKVKPIPPSMRHPPLVSERVTGAVVGLNNSTYSSSVLSFVPGSGGWYMISLMTTVGTGAVLAAPGVRRVTYHDPPPSG